MVIEAQAQAEARFWGNSASPHWLGREAKKAFLEARRDISFHLGCRPSEIVLTSGATESNNLALSGTYEAEQLRKTPRKHVLVSAVEHPSVLEVADALETKGAIVDRIKVDSCGFIDLSDFRSKLTNKTVLVSVMAANNEVGTLQPIADIARLCKEAGAFLHTDATQWLGRIPLNVNSWGVDLLSASAHKLHGPKGVGLLFVRSRLPILEQQHGGGHQGGKRSGTVDVPRAMAFAQALQAAADDPDWDHVQVLREKLFDGLAKHAGPVQRISPAADCLPNTLTVRFKGIDSEALLACSHNVCCSPGSACSHATPQPSHVLIAMGLDREAAGQCLRFSLSQATESAEIDQAIQVIAEAASYVRSALQEVA